MFFCCSCCCVPFRQCLWLGAYRLYICKFILAVEDYVTCHLKVILKHTFGYSSISTSIKKIKTRANGETMPRIQITVNAPSIKDVVRVHSNLFIPPPPLSLSFTLLLPFFTVLFCMAIYIAIEFPWICSYVIQLNALEIHKLFIVVKITSLPKKKKKKCKK